MLESDLDVGEAEAICLALQEEADWLIVDESAGRLVAEKMNLKIVGVLGVLIRAKQDDHIDAIRPLVQKLMLQGFRISPNLLTRVLTAVGEKPL